MCVCPCVRVCLYVCAGLHVVYTQDEVDVVQNLMFYIETAYKVAVSLLIFVLLFLSLSLLPDISYNICVCEPVCLPQSIFSLSLYLFVYVCIAEFKPAHTGGKVRDNVQPVIIAK